MSWWENILISFATSVLSVSITLIINFIINRNKKLKFIIKNAFISDSGDFNFDLVIFNPAKIPQCYDTLYLSFFSGKQKLGKTQLQTPNKEMKTIFGELQCFYVPAGTLQSKTITELSVRGKNKLILTAEIIKIEYYNMAKFLKKNKTVYVKLLNKDKVQQILKDR